MFSKEKYPIKRFTPPTCSLEIWEKSAQTKAPHFVLNFDDPKFSQEEQVSIQGEPSQLPELSQTVKEYLQLFLKDPLKNLSFTHQGNLLHLTRQEGLKHLLSFRNLEFSRNSINLSTSQLFDLVDALEQYELSGTKPKASQNKAAKIALISLFVGLGLLGLYLWRHSIKINKKTPSPTIFKKITSTKNEFPVIAPSQLPSPKPIPSNLVVPPTLAKQTAIAPPSVVVIPSPKIVENQPQAPVNMAIYPSAEPITAAANNNELPLPAPLKNEAPPALTSERIAKVDEHPLESTYLLDTIVQVREVREYFQKNWKVPQDLEHTLEYRLQINPQGAIIGIIPLGRSASIYLNQITMPALNQPFVSPLSNKETATIRLVLLPDGTVKTFLE